VVLIGGNLVRYIDIARVAGSWRADEGLAYVSHHLQLFFFPPRSRISSIQSFAIKHNIIRSAQEVPT